MTAWVGFFLAMVALLFVSQKNLGIAMILGALILGASTIPQNLAMLFSSTITAPSTVLLAAVVALIPVIGASLKASGQLDNLVSNMRIGKIPFLMLSPAIVGLLPMPGGALLSAPLVEKAGRDIPNEKKAGINVWFRHVLYLVYPLSPDLIISAQAAQLDTYQTVPYLVPALVLSLALGYLFFLRAAHEGIDYSGRFSAKKLFVPLAVLLVAPTIDILVEALFAPPVEEASTLIGVSASLVMALFIGRMQLGNFGRIVRQARPWNFAVTMVGILFFLNVFKSSGIPQLLGSLSITPEFLLATAFLLGFGTGRIITPAGIVFPIFLTKFSAIPLPAFAILYFGIFLGYVVTPVHPCVSLSVESFKTGMKDYFKAVTPLTLIALAVSFMLLYTMNL